MWPGFGSQPLLWGLQALSEGMRDHVSVSIFLPRKRNNIEAEKIEKP